MPYHEPLETPQKQCGQQFRVRCMNIPEIADKLHRHFCYAYVRPSRDHTWPTSAIVHGHGALPPASHKYTYTTLAVEAILSKLLHTQTILAASTRHPLISIGYNSYRYIIPQSNRVVLLYLPDTAQPIKREYHIEELPVMLDEYDKFDNAGLESIMGWDIQSDWNSFDLTDPASLDVLEQNIIRMLDTKADYSRITDWQWLVG